jgi:exodeoxyribonuclease V alpha subunit
LQIKGVVNEIIFRNAENGYTVVDIDNDGVLTTAVGIFPPISEGEQLLLDGEFKFNNRFGEQFVADKVRISPPNSEENIIRFLSSGLFRGIGKVYAEHIVERFKSDTLTIIETMPSEIASIKGIGLKKATELSETFNNNKEMQETIIYLQQYDISVYLAIKIYKKYRNTTQFVITTNPYKMIADIDGIGFLTADKIALNMGLQRDSSYRVKACIGYVLNDSALKNGNTYLTENDILKEVIKMLEFGEDRIDFVNEMINDMLIMDDVKIIRRQDYNAVMLTKYYNLERNISKKILALNDRSGIINEDIDSLISEYEFINKIKLHETQKDAVVSALNNGCLKLQAVRALVKPL